MRLLDTLTWLRYNLMSLFYIIAFFLNDNPPLIPPLKQAKFYLLTILGKKLKK